ncbi:P-loop NTPase fold protein [Microlunatus sp. Gsoil 973]|uniref:KAP family P-loop NTPase fold protein n=1 Tax=Microlunatus sp. Gsoil 973 TaxID=2672569 RepID=UPI0012B4C85F|nr:P-loop NTPase fold protein [Microlunatus sp. Gsoil 973]QGN33951.1 ATPase [Microlunatus sp. Gsoil 973]
MWTDTETNIDYINFSTVADSVVELIEQAEGKPLSIGVSGAWGVGKSSLVMLTKDALERRERQRARDQGIRDDDDFQSKYIFVSFNAWLYQGYDDARAALMEAIAVKLAEVAEERKTGVEKTRDFLRRIDWFRLASLTAGSAAALALGPPPVGLIGQFASLFSRGRRNGVDDNLIEDAQGAVTQAAGEAKGLLRDKPAQDESPRQRIQALRDSFVAALQELEVTLVVLIDDLDRCLPETAVSTLEAIRLFLFLDGTAFVIAADDQMIKHAVKKHFDQPDDALVTNYFDKLIQIPIRVPTLGTQEVRAYMFLLYVHNSMLGESERERIRIAVCDRLAKTWQGLRIDRAFIQGLGIDLPNELVAQLDTADRLTPIMATASGIAGNPRLVKRFLNALSVRMAVAKTQGVSVDEAALAKLLLFERLAPAELYQELATSITNSVDGKPHLLDGLEPEDLDNASATPTGSTGFADLRDQADTATVPGPKDKVSGSQRARSERDGGTNLAVAPIPERWATGFVSEWLALPPRLADIDMRGALYVSREHLPILTAEDGLSSTATELLKALIEHPSEAGALTEPLRELSGPEQSRIFERLLDLARPIDAWGVPDIFEALLVMVQVGPDLSGSLAGFLGGRPAAQIQPDLIPRISGQPWASDLMTAWAGNPDIEAPVKAAIASRLGNGNVAK